MLQTRKYFELSQNVSKSPKKSFRRIVVRTDLFFKTRLDSGRIGPTLGKSSRIQANTLRSCLSQFPSIYESPEQSRSSKKGNLGQQTRPRQWGEIEEIFWSHKFAIWAQAQRKSVSAGYREKSGEEKEVEWVGEIGKSGKWGRKKERVEMNF